MQLAAYWVPLDFTQILITVMSHEYQCLKSLATQLFVQQLVEAYSKENIKAPGDWPFVREMVASGFPSQRFSNAESFR